MQTSENVSPHAAANNMSILTAFLHFPFHVFGSAAGREEWKSCYFQQGGIYQCNECTTLKEVLVLALAL